MTIFDRYIGRQVLLSAFFAVLVLTIILVLGKVFKDILTELVKRPDLDAGFVFRFLLLVLPISISISVPWAFLISTRTMWTPGCHEPQLTSETSPTA